jgi:hypothetical protein
LKAQDADTISGCPSDQDCFVRTPERRRDSDIPRRTGSLPWGLERETLVIFMTATAAWAE